MISCSIDASLQGPVANGPIRPRAEIYASLLGPVTNGPIRPRAQNEVLARPCGLRTNNDLVPKLKPPGLAL